MFGYTVYETGTKISMFPILALWSTLLKLNKVPVGEDLSNLIANIGCRKDISKEC